MTDLQPKQLKLEEWDQLRPHNVVLFSGGMDSTTLLTDVIRQHGTELTTALTIEYGSNHNNSEIMAADEITRHLGVKWALLTLPNAIFQGAGSALMGEMAIPDGEYRKNGPQDTVVPFRNGVMISVAVAFAHRFGPSNIWIAAHSDDGDAWAYPDCRPEFFEPLSEAITAATMTSYDLIFPYVYMTKADIVRMAGNINAPLGLSYSCYEGRELHCGVCATCVDRRAAFIKANRIDPTKYEVKP